MFPSSPVFRLWGGGGGGSSAGLMHFVTEAPQQRSSSCFLVPCVQTEGGEVWLAARSEAEAVGKFSKLYPDRKYHSFTRGTCC